MRGTPQPEMPEFPDEFVPVMASILFAFIIFMILAQIFLVNG